MRYILLFLLSVLPFSAYAGNRFTMELEYQLMDYCVGATREKKTKIKICACALRKTQEDGFGPDYDNDEDFYEDKRDFMNSFSTNIKKCQQKQE